MNTSSREVLLTCAQITSLQSLLGFWTPDRLLTSTIALAVLCVIGFWLTRTTLRAHTEEQSIVAVGAWSAFGLLASYHRAHDAIALLLLLPYLLGRLHQAPADWKAWTVIACGIAMSLGPSTTAIQQQVASGGTHSLIAFLLLRQVSVLDVCLLLALIVTLREMGQRVPALIPARAYRPEQHFRQLSLIGNSIHGPVRGVETPQQ